MDFTFILYMFVCLNLSLCFLSDMTKILELDPSNDQARRTIIRLKPLADEKREKMKEEMIGTLNFLVVHVVLFSKFTLCFPQ